MLHPITIPKPCHENWNAMTPDGNGRHCSSCSKTVVDFTGMPDEEVKRFLVDRLPGQVCGRFRGDQVQRIAITLPENIFELPLPWWKRFLVAGLLAFSTMLFSCDSNVQGKVVITQEKPADSIPEPPPPKDGRTMGEPVLSDSIKHTKPVCVKGQPVVDTLIPEIMGEVALPPVQKKGQ